MKEASLKRIRKLPFRMFIFLIIFICISVVQSAENIGTKTVRFKAKISDNFHTKTYKEIRLKENNFVTGIEGDVTWKPKSFYEAFILENIINKNAPLALLNILYLMVLDGVLFWMVYDIEENKLFNEKIIRGFNLLTYLAVLWMVKESLNFYLSNYYIKEITNGQFQAISSSEFFSVLPFVFVGIFSQVLSYLILKAQKIEHEQKLTV